MPCPLILQRKVCHTFLVWNCGMVHDMQKPFAVLWRDVFRILIEGQPSLIGVHNLPIRNHWTKGRKSANEERCQTGQQYHIRKTWLWQSFPGWCENCQKEIQSAKRCSSETRVWTGKQIASTKLRFRQKQCKGKGWSKTCGWQHNAGKWQFSVVAKPTENTRVGPGALPKRYRGTLGQDSRAHTWKKQSKFKNISFLVVYLCSGRQRRIFAPEPVCFCNGRSLWRKKFVAHIETRQSGGSAVACFPSNTCYWSVVDNRILPLVCRRTALRDLNTWLKLWGNEKPLQMLRNQSHDKDELPKRTPFNKSKSDCWRESASELWSQSPPMISWSHLCSCWCLWMTQSCAISIHVSVFYNCYTTTSLLVTGTWYICCPFCGSCFSAERFLAAKDVCRLAPLLLNETFSPQNAVFLCCLFFLFEMQFLCVGSTQTKFPKKTELVTSRAPCFHNGSGVRPLLFTLSHSCFARQ